MKLFLILTLAFIIGCNQKEKVTVKETHFNGFPIKPGFKGQDWELEDCKKAHQKSPQTFEIPSDEEEQLVKVGQLLRLHFLTGSLTNDIPRAERMWVEVCQLLEDGLYRGHLTNQPKFIDSLNPGDVIEFRWKHVAQIYITKEDPRHESKN